METVNIHQAKTDLSSIVTCGTEKEIIISNKAFRGKLVPFRTSSIGRLV